MSDDKKRPQDEVPWPGALDRNNLYVIHGEPGSGRRLHEPGNPHIKHVHIEWDQMVDRAVREDNARSQQFRPPLWMVAGIAFAGGLLAVVILLWLFPQPGVSDRIEVPTEVTTVKPTYTPFTRVPTRPPHPMEIYRPPGYDGPSWTPSTR